MSNNKTDTVIARMESDTKHVAESILERIGIPASVAINMFYKIIIMCNGIPFSLTAEKEVPVSLDDDAISEMITTGYRQAKNGEGRPTKEVTNKLREELKG